MPYCKAEADRAVAFIKALKHTEGKYAGHYFTLLPWQEKIIRDIFGTLREDGSRQYSTIYIEIPRKNGKTHLLAAIAVYMLVLDHEIGGQVYCAANDKDQASILFNAAARMIEQEPALMKITRLLKSLKRIEYPATNSVLRAISAEAYTKHGYGPSAVFYDELHAAPDRELYDVLRTGMGARENGLFFVITTAGFDRTSICWELHEYAQRIDDGEIADPSFYSAIFAAEQNADWTDPEVWAEANPSLGHTIQLEFLKSECTRAKQNPAFQNTFRRLYLNQWTQQNTRWIDMDAWALCGDGMPEIKNMPNIEVYTGCYGGLDLAATSDLTALVLAFSLPDRRIVFKPHFYIPIERISQKMNEDRVPYDAWVRDGLITATPGQVVDYNVVRDDALRFIEEYGMCELAYDPWSAVQLATELEGNGAELVQVSQNMRNLSPPTKEFYRLMLERRLCHGNNPVLNWMASNVEVMEDKYGNIRPIKSKKTGRIDGIIAAIMALDRALRNANEEQAYADGSGLLLI